MDVTLEGIFTQWTEGNALLDSINTRIQDLDARDPLRFQRSRHPFPFRPRHIEKERLSLANHIRDDLCRHAEKRFAGGLALTIDPSSLNDLVYERFDPCQVGLRPGFDPRTLWATLEKRFTGKDGADEACRVAADAIIRATRRSQPDYHDGAVADFYLLVRQETYLRHEGRYQLSMSVRDDLRCFTKGFRCFLRWAGVNGECQEYAALDALESFITEQAQHGYASRVRVGNDTMGFRFFKERGEFWIAQELRTKLFEFTTVYGTAYRQPGAVCWLRGGRPSLV